MLINEKEGFKEMISKDNFVVYFAKDILGVVDEEQLFDHMSICQ